VEQEYGGAKPGIHQEKIDKKQQTRSPDNKGVVCREYVTMVVQNRDSTE
jgi:hypothetical protein